MAWIRDRCPGSGSLPASVSITSPAVPEEAVPVPLNERSSTPDLLSYLRSRPKILKRVPRASRERASSEKVGSNSGKYCIVK